MSTPARLTDPLADAPLTARDKGIPDRAVGATVSAFLATAPRLDEFWTPLVVLDDSAMRHNARTLQAWCDERGLSLMPHGKTTMAPALWQRQLDEGCLGITLATMGQVRAGRSLGLDSIMLANAAVDARGLRWLAAELADPGFRFVSWVDSIATVEAMEAGLAGAAPRPVEVCVELGAPGGRTGARSIAEARAVAERISASRALRLAGVAGYEGSLGHDRSPAALSAVRGYLESQVELHASIAHLYDAGDVFLTAGGSAYFDVVAEVYASVATGPRPDGTHVRAVLRSGAYLVHDDGFYREISPFDEARADDAAPRLRNAMHGIARVVSHPEAGLALLDGGKRDLPFDEGLPIPRRRADDLGGPWHPLADATLTHMNDQHSYLRGAGAEAAPVGAVVELGLSHPCTAFDKWRILPVVASADDYRVIDLVRTWF